ncbi:hypothetical protein [Actinacidiphila rubida]|uniref:Uncharacterized protein n=1 Tax=Actinacidiphila rubida TaxID=310780 RepID=A0A1H8ENU2_9ACTN|nr:hypothetical protein [Actinacidiphila rubida]SEN20764.1 hypothetical protein SAMN05216267_1002285 [Actinacidiphila rubida]
MPTRESLPDAASHGDSTPIPSLEDESRPSAARVRGVRFLALVVLAALLVLVVAIVRG